MEKIKPRISDALSIYLLSGSKLDHVDSMRVSIFTIDCQRVAETMNPELPKEMFITEFMSKIKKTHGYIGFSNFCHITEEGLIHIIEKVYAMVKYNID